MTNSESDQSLQVRNRNKRPNQLGWWLCTLGALAIGSWYFIHANWPDQYVHLTVCDVGQGDAILIHQGFHQVLIDSSQDDRVLECLNRILPPWDHELDLVLVTHFHRDHVGGLASVLEVYRIRMLITQSPSAAFIEQNPQLSKQLTTATTKGMVWKRPILGQQIDLGFSAPEGVLEILQALPGENQVNQNWSDNNQSIVALVRLNQVKMLLTGDLEEAGEQVLLQHSLPTPIDILKVGHHGSKTSTTEELLKAIRPQLALISVGRRNSYGHPAPGTLAKFAKYGVTVLSTADVGDIDIVSDGQRYWQAKSSH